MRKKKLNKYCPSCKREREFVRIVEAHRETEPITIHTVVNAPLRSWIEERPLPIAYCSACNTVIYVG